jgi:protein-S-isoprenylcysteine O-methyltransferase Ste14
VRLFVLFLSFLFFFLLSLQHTPRSALLQHICTRRAHAHTIKPPVPTPSKKQVFPVADIPLPVLALVFVVVGPGYALGAYYAFTSAVEPPPLLVGAAIMIFVWGSLINAGTDFYKDGFKAAKPKAVVTGGPFALARHINWFGDWLR